MASPAASLEPTIESSWQDFVEHLPTLLLLWVVTAVIGGVGLLGSAAIQAGGLSLALIVGAGDKAELISSALAPLGQVPFSILSGFVGVLFHAVPAMHYATGRVISLREALGELARRPGRYLAAGILFSLVSTVGTLLCLLPGLVVLLVMPIYVNLIFTGDRPVLEVFQASFQICYGTPEGRSFLLVEFLTWLVVFTVTVCTCLLGGLVAGPMSNFYLQNLAYHRGLLR